MCENDCRDTIGTSLDLAVTHLRHGGIVAFPTETYYGLAVDPDCESAVDKLFAVKNRPIDKPLLLLIAKIAQLNSIVQNIPPVYRPLMKKYWPGPLTLIFPAGNLLNRQLTGNSGTVGIRISPHPIAWELVSRMGKPITGTSANISGLPPARSAREVVEMLGNRIDYVLDGGQTPGGLCSTIVCERQGKLTILRHGQIDVPEVGREVA